jgi:phenylpropionate dioxygenase-like ring-hydroxylating dioxygenase large terminal subunit
VGSIPITRSTIPAAPAVTTLETTLDRATATALNKRLLENLAQRSTDVCEAECRLPAKGFCCDETLAWERAHLFYNTPQPVAFSGEIPESGSYLALQVLDVPVLLTRDENGQLHAFINACSHRGAQVASDSGKATSLVCPFHGWAYRLDGTLRGRPQDHCFDTPQSECALTALPVSENYGIVVVGISSTMSQREVDTALDELGHELASYHFENYLAVERREHAVEANWKLVTDLSLESYHFNSLHRDSVAQILSPNAVVDTYGRHSRWAFPLKSIERLTQLDEDDWPDRIEGSCTYTLFPGVMFIVNALGAQMIRAEPAAKPGASRVIYAGVCAPDCDLEQARQAYAFGGDVFAQEDLPAAQQCQRGLAATQRDLILGRNEPLLQFWHQLWCEPLAPGS